MVSSRRGDGVMKRDYSMRVFIDRIPAILEIDLQDRPPALRADSTRCIRLVSYGSPDSAIRAIFPAPNRLHRCARVHQYRSAIHLNLQAGSQWPWPRPKG